jgi:hypothetical protein
VTKASANSRCKTSREYFKKERKRGGQDILFTEKSFHEVNDFSE